ncbi:MAG: hypothetical protein ABIF80_04820 [Patescibacteria group bacterium]
MQKTNILIQEKILVQGTIVIEKWTTKASWYENILKALSSPLRVFF